MFENVLPFILKSAGIGFIIGFIIGIAFKKLSKFIVIVIGVLIIFLQILVYNNIIEIDWLSLKEHSENVSNQFNTSKEFLRNISITNLPFSTTSIIGFIFGVKKG